MKTIRRCLALGLASITGFGVLALSPVAAQAAVDPLHDGLSEATAAASCWEIKQNNPRSSDGTYWLQTATMDAPGQFFCDQTTDGGGWVMIGRGREGWETWSQGKGDQTRLQTRPRTPGDFEVVQASHETVNGLLGGTKVSDLPDGVMVQRAWNHRGNAYQTVRMQFPKMRDFIWPFKSAHPVNVKFNREWWVNGGIVWSGFGTNTSWGYVNLNASPQNQYTMGFGYGPLASSWYDTSSSTSFFHRNGSIINPYAEVYIRPELSSTDSSFRAIGDGGTAAETQKASVSEYATPTTWGVTGNLNGSIQEGSIQVQAFEQVGSTMYVGGNFTGVQKGKNGSETTSRGLAAFDATTGDWTGQTFDFNNQVKDLVELPGGKLLAVGDFTKVNGETHVGTVLIDAATGQIDPSWDLQIRNGNASVVTVKAAKVVGEHIYLAGAFTHLTGNGSSSVYARNGARLDLSGKPDRSWNPEFNGAVIDIDVDENDSYLYAAGHFTRAHDLVAENAARLSTGAGAELDQSWSFRHSYFIGKYQQAVTVGNGRVYFGGSQHSLFGYNTSDMTRTSGSITMQNGGDLQATTASATGVVYGSCHCSDYAFQDAYQYLALGDTWTRADEIQWVGGWDQATGRQIGWTPYRLSSLRSTGAWALEMGDDGALWVGGDFNFSYTSKTAGQWSGGWVRMPARSATAPAVPANLRASDGNAKEVTLKWSSVPGAESYDILRDDRTIATTTSTSITVPLGGNNRFFLRAVASDGLRGASTHAYTVDANGQPTQPDDSTVLVEDDATWAYHWSTDAVSADWAQTSYDDSSWSRGTAPIGYGAADLGTTLKPGTPKTRPLTTYARTTFTVADPTAIGGVNVAVTADDGAVVYVNGTEIVRQRMNDGAVTAGTYASASVTTASARADRQLVFVPASQLVAGTNTLAVETHLNYRSSSSMTIDGTVQVVAKADVPEPEPQPEPEPEPAPQPDPDKPITPDPDQPLEVLDVSGVNFGEFLPTGQYWNYWNSKDAPDAAWNSTADLSKWKHGASPLGWGDRDAATPFVLAASERPIATYFARDVNLGTISADFELTLDVRVDDGAVIYVNGTEVKRVNMPEGAVTNNTNAKSNVSLGAAKKNLATVSVPRDVLKDGVNRIAVEEHANYAGAVSVSFDLKGSLLR
ncbi:fibrinogen-like YCDxxxxGGGW domain-containing protein [uncultured Actinomyces sp.]|uniref:fibrinogen-like YCDxxxxGGGW domain-containing protein n=1 Tax=uncultured Actinomyces sp. TaxID=249061 RepID=UPI0028D74515|nr:fibrinogen-like YCDxxxxGGGW domain-containing protein [uncultured Actinomyces sp.]